jgi:hypothetical protein
MFAEADGVGQMEKSLFFNPLFSNSFSAVSVRELIFCQKKFLPNSLGCVKTKPLNLTY